MFESNNTPFSMPVMPSRRAGTDATGTVKKVSQAHHRDTVTRPEEHTRKDGTSRPPLIVFKCKNYPTQGGGCIRVVLTFRTV